MGRTESYLKTESIKQNSLDMGFIQHGAKCIKSKTIEHQHILNSYHIDSGDTGGDRGNNSDGHSWDADGHDEEGGSEGVLEVKRVVIMVE